MALAAVENACQEGSEEEAMVNTGNTQLNEINAKLDKLLASKGGGNKIEKDGGEATDNDLEDYDELEGEEDDLDNDLDNNLDDDLDDEEEDNEGKKKKHNNRKTNKNDEDDEQV